MAAANGGARVPTLATTQLANTKDGNWKVLANGTRVELTDAQWRQELAHLFSKGSAAGKPPTPTS